MPSFGEIIYIAEWIIRIAMLLVVPLRRSPAATRGWLLLVFFLPVPGLILYLAIGTPRFPKWRVKRFQTLQPFFLGMAKRLADLGPAAGTRRDIAELGQRLGLFPAVGGNRVEFLDDYDRCIDRLVADIDAAHHHIRLLAYIFADDATGTKVIAALARAAERGVRCHVLVDAVGSHRWLRATLHRLASCGVEAHATLPFHLLRGRTRRDMRNHRKIFLIDGAVGYTGSQNIVAKDFRPGVTNRELVVRLTGPAVAALEAVFVADWFLETGRMLDETPAVPNEAGTAVLQVLPSGANYPMEGFQTLLVWQIHEARTRAVVVTPYLIPDEDLLGALRTAALRGVEVDIVVSAVVDQPLVALAQRSYYEELLASGVRVHLFREVLLHAKNVSIDDRLGIVGSSNVDIRSFQLNDEVSLLMLDPGSVAALIAIQNRYLENSDGIDPVRWRRRGRWRRLVENAARLVGPLL